MEKTVKAWVIVDRETGDFLEGQVTSVMSEGLVEFYNKPGLNVKAVPCKITYQVDE